MPEPKPEFTAHNIRLDDGTCTRSADEPTLEEHPWFLAAKRLLETVFPGDRGELRLADLGCLEGGYSVGFARMGFQVLGLEVRASNFAACEYVQSRVDLPVLRFAKDDVMNIERHGAFDAVFCCGLLYHLDRPRRLLELLGSVTRKVLIVQTHFSVADDRVALEPGVRGWLRRRRRERPRFQLSELTENEGLAGRWYHEFSEDEAMAARERSKWASWSNARSFWIQREHLIAAIHGAGFDLVAEQFDGLGPDIAESLQSGYYATDTRGTFVGVKTPSTI